MVHGNPTWSYLYRHLIKQLRPDHRCIATDHIGFGLSDKPNDWSYLPAGHAANLTALIDGLGLKDITLVLQDWGGPIGLSYAVAHPDNVARLIIMNTWAWPVNRDWYYIAFSGFMGGPIGRWLIRRYNLFARSVMRQAFGDKRKLTPAAHEQYFARPAYGRRPQGLLRLPPTDRQGHPVAGPALEQRLCAEKQTYADRLGHEGYRVQREGAEALGKHLPAARTVRLSSVGHFVQEEAPAELAAAVVPFLKDIGPFAPADLRDCLIL